MASVVKDEGSGYPIALDSFIPDLSAMSYSTLLTQTVLACVIVYVIFSKFNRKPRERELSEEEKEALIASWEPEPLVPETPPDHPALNPKYVDGKMTKYVQIDGKEYLNVATTNFLGLVGDERIEATAKKTIMKYGVGSCGPRGFYGTVDVHLDLEKELAEFLGCEEAVLYSYGFATIASAIPAYARRGDVIFVDKGVNFAIQKGVQASRSRIEWFNHNDMDDLERLLEEQAKLDLKDPKKAAKTRRFMVVEGLYYNLGDLCPLPRLLELKWKYKVRIFIDESISFGVLGKTGRGICEHYGVDVIDVDMIMASLENALATTGGFCAGRSFVVGHQRLSGLGYCFSASLPPLLATAASEGLRVLGKEPDRFERLHRNARFMHNTLKKVFESSRFVINGDELSPVQHIYYDNEESHGTELESDEKLEDSEKKVAREMAGKKLDELVDKMFERGITLTRARYLNAQEAFPIRPSIRLMLQSELNEDELNRIVKAFEEILPTID